MLGLASVSRAGSLEEAARGLARQIASLAEARAPLRLAWSNASSLPEAESEDLRRVFVAELTSRRAALTGEAAAPELRVSLRETPAHLLFVAALSGAGDSPEVRMVQVPRAGISVAEHPPSILRLQKELLWRQREPLLDAAELPGDAARPGLLLLLGRESLALLHSEKDGWALQDSAPLLPAAAPARDLRGEIRLEGPRAQIILPGRICDASFERKISLDCRVGSEPWRAKAPLRSPCDVALWQLATGSGDWSVADHIRLESEHGKSSGAAAARPLDLPGPVLSLSPAPENRSAWAVVWNLASGNYEVYRITLACGN
ncbi:MAG: hypothetical protein LAN84_08810 [Acidobacteriia bacterium]|nr:hypothetical protein [Terriglobia bacterium]